MRYLMILLALCCVAFESYAVICGGCQKKSNPGAKYCFNCGKQLPAPSTLEEQYEALMREAMPTLLALEQTPEKDMGVKTEESIRKEMTKFRAMSPTRQKQEYKTAQAAVARFSQTTHNAVTASANSASQATESENASAMAVKGHNLFVAIIMANTEREAAGLTSVWPKSPETKSDEKDDISSIEFNNSSDYFRTLFDLKKATTKEWAPYVAGVDWTIAFPKGTASSQWIVAKGITDEMSDNIPVIVSSNVDAKSLISESGNYNSSRLKGSLEFSGEWAILIYKGGVATALRRKYASLSNVYKKNLNFTIPKGFGYLNP